MIVTLTINPALDKSTTVEKFVPEKKMRCTALRVEAGGGGINVSKAIKELGGKSIAFFPAGGVNGKVLSQILRKSQIPHKSIQVKGETRESFSATELATNSQYRFVMPGSELTKKEIDLCISQISSLKPFPSIIVASGSLPPGDPAASPENGDPRHRQHLHCAVQGHEPGNHHRPVRLAQQRQTSRRRPEVVGHGH